MLLRRPVPSDVTLIPPSPIRSTTGASTNRACTFRIPGPTRLLSFL